MITALLEESPDPMPLHSCTPAQHQIAIIDCDEENMEPPALNSDRFAGSLDHLFINKPSRLASFRRDMRRMEKLMVLQERMERMAKDAGGNNELIASEQRTTAKEIARIINRYPAVDFIEVFGSGYKAIKQRLEEK